MKLIDIKGFVLKEQPYKENDKIIWVLCENIGKVSILAKNAKKMKNSNFILTQPFSLVQLTLKKGKSFYYIEDGSLIKNIDFIKNGDIIFYLSYFFELLDLSFGDKDELPPAFFRVILRIFLILDGRSYDLDLIMRIFEIKILEFLGCRLSLNHCHHCMKMLSKEDKIGYFSFSFQSVICDSCGGLKEFKLGNRIINIIRFLTKVSIKSIPRISITNEDMDTIFKFNMSLLDQNLIRMPNSIKFLGGY